ncbi:MAG: tRNA (adenosine(37)-N6)-threonylcarbamoyltransferase complex transferase subunit TsaD, partial [Patescibacteria group bacterium]
MKTPPSRRILAIETSCDETAIAVLEAREDKNGAHFNILADKISSQVAVHAPFGGVVPNLAKREHQKNLVPLLIMALKEADLYKKDSPKNSLQATSYKLQALLSREPELLKHFEKELPKIKKPAIDAIAVTYGPGLEPALWVGINFARALSKLWNLPLIPVNHLEGHIYSAFMRPPTFYVPPTKQIFPLLTLIVSGGHTELVLTKNHLSHKILGETHDDAAGEAFDKVAKMLGLPYPGGPEISKRAREGNSAAINFPRPMLHSKDLHFSFSGLKTSVLYHLQETGKPSEKSKNDIAASFQQAAV